MSFSNVDIFRNTVNTLNTSGSKQTADQITKGGAFSPNTFEAVALMRADLDNQWDNSFTTKYTALMQNRLNRLKEELTNAYKAVLESSAVQQVRENGMNASNSAITDVYGNLLGGSANASEAFRGLSYYEDEAQLDAADGAGGSSKDGVPSYMVNGTLTQYKNGAVDNTRSGAYEMRSLYVNGPALSIVNDMKVALRTEEVPTKKTTVNVLGVDIGGLFGAMPFTGGEKVAEYSAEVKTGGFWSSINYLYNFAPREMRYSYVDAYSTTSEEAGTRQKDGVQATLYNSDLVDARDGIQDNDSASMSTEEDNTVPTYGTGVIGSNPRPPNGARIKWASSNPSDGYITEKSPQFNDFTKSGEDHNEFDNRLITRRASDNDDQFINIDNTMFAEADGVVKSGSGGWTGFTTVSSGPGADRQQNGIKQTVYGTEEFGAAEFADRIKWEYAHDGVGAADLNRDGKINSSDTHDAKAIFINHYTLQTQEVEMNSSVDSWGKIEADDTVDGNGNILVKREKTLRSAGIDGSAEHTLNDAVKQADRVQRVDQVDSDNDNDLGGTDDTNEKLLLSGSGKISKGFTGDYVSRQYQIKSFNGQDIATNSANVTISSANAGTEPVVLAEYEGFRRAQSMSMGMADDVFADATAANRTRAEAIALAKKYQIEVNAAKMVDTDWHYSDYVNGAKDQIMFRNVTGVAYTDNGTTGLIPVDFDPTIRDSQGTFTSETVAFRKTFKLTPSDFQTMSFSTPSNKDIYINTPTFTNRDVFVKVTTTGTGGELIVNGKKVTNTAADLGGGVYNLRDFLVTADSFQDGDNVITYQAAFGGGSDNFKLESTGVGASTSNLNAEDIDKWLGIKASTESSKTQDYALSALNDSISNTHVSSWQSKLMVQKAGDLNIIKTALIPAADLASFNGAFADPINPSPAELVAANAKNLSYLDDVQKRYKNELNNVGSVYTTTQVKESNSFAKILTYFMNKREYRDIFTLGLLNYSAGKNMVIKAQVSAPTGGSLNATIEVRFDPITNKFIIIQTKLDALG
jgi:hypothetical protein